MYRFYCILIATGVALSLLLPAAGYAQDIQALTQQAQQAANTRKDAQALGLYELALTESVDRPDATFGPLDGQYWRLIATTNDFPRALDFFTALTAKQSSPSATLMANQANAIGGYFGWLQKSNLIGSMPPASLRQMDATARKSYDQALALDPDNFTALFGYAIYESYSPSPDAKAHMKQLLAKLDTLRSSHPQYPWPMVDYLEKNGHPQQ